jgi:hypothetical protein
MTESDVKVIAGAITENYEEKIGGPRHTQNVEKFDSLFGVLNKMKGAMWALALLTGVPGIAASCFVIVKAIRGH